MTRMFFSNGDARCGNCHRLLFKISNNARVTGIEIKCHSCKQVNVTEFHFCERCRYLKDNICTCELSECLMMERDGKDTCKCWEKQKV